MTAGLGPGLVQGRFEVLRDDSRRRWDAVLDGEVVGHATWSPSARAADTVILGHTEVSPRHEGRGLGAALVRAILDDLRGRGMSVIPVCSFAAAYVRRHREYADLVPQAERTRLGL